MIYFWLLPVLLLVVVMLLFMRKGATKRRPVGRSRLDEARDQ